MTFKDNYTNQINNISPDSILKSKIRNKLTEDTPPKRKTSYILWGRAVAAGVLCLALLCSVLIFSNNRKIAPISPVSPSAPLNEAKSYDKIFETMNKLKSDYMSDGSEIYNDALNEGTAEKTTGTLGATADHSETTTQVDGVDEADIVKTDGKYIFSLSSVYFEKNKINIIDPANGKPVLLSTIKSEKISISEMYLSKNRLILLGTESQAYSQNIIEDSLYNNTDCAAEIYDISDPKKPELIETCFQSGYYNNSRLIGNELYLLSNYSVNYEKIDKNSPDTYVPNINCKNYSGTVSAESINFSDNCNCPEYTIISSYDITNGSLCSTQSILGGCFTVYCSQKNIITISYDKDNKSAVSRFAINNGKIELKATAKISGTLLNQFSIDEYKDHFRFVTTVYSGKETRTGGTVSYRQNNVNTLVILDENLKQTGIIENIAPEERVYSVRFMGDIAYFVTFKQVDPLFSADLSDPASPKIVGSLKIPGLSDYLSPFGDGKLLGIGRSADEKTGVTTGMKLSMFDISNPANVTESSKTPIEANYSEALNNHKACLCDENKNIIAFSVYDNIGVRYMIYSYENGGFVKKADIRLDADCQNSRGIYIDNIFYITAKDEILSYDINSFKQIAKTSLG